MVQCAVDDDDDDDNNNNSGGLDSNNIAIAEGVGEVTYNYLDIISDT